MFVKTIKLKKAAKTLVILLIALAVLFLALYSLNRLISPKGITLESQSEQIEFLSGLGWEISPEPIDCRTVMIPEEWNEVYTQYNSLQLQQGFDLDGYRGKYAEIYTYEIYNYPDGDEPKQNIVAHLMICDGRLIAGDVCSTEFGGFMQGLMKTEQH